MCTSYSSCQVGKFNGKGNIEGFFSAYMLSINSYSMRCVQLELQTDHLEWPAFVVKMHPKLGLFSRTLCSVLFWNS